MRGPAAHCHMARLCVWCEQEFWRLYELDCSSVTCRILERFAHDTFSRSAPAAGEGR